jgi:hypothetical protein
MCRHILRIICLYIYIYIYNYIYRNSFTFVDPPVETIDTSYDELDNNTHHVYDKDNDDVNNNDEFNDDIKNEKKNSFKNLKNNNMSIDECGGLNMMKITDQVQYLRINV